VRDVITERLLLLSDRLDKQPRYATPAELRVKSYPGGEAELSEMSLEVMHGFAAVLVVVGALVAVILNIPRPLVGTGVVLFGGFAVSGLWLHLLRHQWMRYRVSSARRRWRNGERPAHPIGYELMSSDRDFLLQAALAFACAAYLVLNHPW
jgi:hypothetical protein